jgi:glutamyl-tRNA reductase
VPRDIDPEVNFLENVYLYNIDDLQAIADDYLRLRKEEIARCEKIIIEKVAALLETNKICNKFVSIPKSMTYEPGHLG